MTPENRAAKAWEDWLDAPPEDVEDHAFTRIVAATIRDAEFQIEHKYQTLIEELRVELEMSRANARYYASVVIELRERGYSDDARNAG